MKTKLLRRLRKQVPLMYYKGSKEVKDSDTGELIEGKYCVRNPLTKVRTFGEDIITIRKLRRNIILEVAQDIRYRNNKNYKVLE